MSVAQEYPARQNADGSYWFRPTRDRGESMSQWGWTNQLDMAHPDYFAGGDVPRGCQRVEINGHQVLVHLADVNKPLTEGDIAALTEFSQHLERQSQPEENTPMTELLADGTPDLFRRSEVCGFPLPPFPEQVNVQFDGWKRYKLPSPTTGKLTAYTRATTVASVTPDDYNLAKWKEREKVRAAIECAEASQLADEADRQDAPIDELTAMKAQAYSRYLDAMDGGKGKEINAAIDWMQDVCGGAESREHGGAVHDWIAELDMGRVLLHQIPEQYQVHARAYQDAMARAGLIAVPEWTERLVLNMRGPETIAGRLDGIAYCVETGTYHVLDRKTSKTLDFSALEFGIQVAGVYSWSQLMLKVDRSGWDRMPKIAGIPHPDDHEAACPEAETDLWPGTECGTCGAAADDTEPMAFIAHIPSDQPERSQVVPIAVRAGAGAMMTALQVREERRSADKTFFGQSYPIPSAESLRYVAARQRLQNLQSIEDAHDVLAEYEDVMDDDLREFGATCFALINTDTDN